MDKTAVPAANDHFRAATHGGVAGGVRKSQAVDAVERICGDAADHVTGIDILQIQLKTLPGKVRVDAVFQKEPNISQLCFS